MIKRRKKGVTSLVTMKGNIPGALVQGGHNAGLLLYILAAKSSGVIPTDDRGQPVDEATVTEIKRAVRAQPQTALAILANDVSTGLSPIGKAKALDAVIGLVGDDERSTVMVRDQFTPSTLIEIMRASGDLPSAVALIADQRVVFEAMIKDAFAGSELPKDRIDLGEYSFILLSWARNLKDRKDWEEMLDLEVGESGRTLREFVVSSIHFIHRPFRKEDLEEEEKEAGFEGEVDDEDGSRFSLDAIETFAQYGIEVDSFEEMRDYCTIVVRGELEEARRHYTQRQATLKTSALQEAEEAASATQGVTDAVDL